jgi:RNase H-fold protein (predicted Holliday junction resolvase)
MEAKLLLSKLTPMKSVLCIVQSSQNGWLGAAMSDPYLGVAAPLSKLETVDQVQECIREHQPGALAFGLPIQRPDQSIVRLLNQRSQLVDRSWSVPLICHIDEQLSLEEARSRKKTEWEMWEDINLDDHDLEDPSVEAAVALNAWLWEHCGGWRNTFG